MAGYARYTIVEDAPGEPLVIRDIGPWHMHRTVTNDAEAVVSELVAEGRLPPGRRLHYYDSEGEIGRIVVVDGKFEGFEPVEDP